MIIKNSTKRFRFHPKNHSLLFSMFIFTGLIGTAFLLMLIYKNNNTKLKLNEQDRQPLTPSSPSSTPALQAPDKEAELSMFRREITRLNHELHSIKQSRDTIRILHNSDTRRLQFELENKEYQLELQRLELKSLKRKLTETTSQLETLQRQQAGELKRKFSAAEAEAKSTLTTTPSSLFATAKKTSAFVLPHIILNPSKYILGSAPYIQEMANKVFHTLSLARQKTDLNTDDGIPVSHKIIFSINQQDMENISRPKMLAEMLSAISNAKKLSAFTQDLIEFIWNDPETVLMLCVHPLSEDDNTLGEHRAYTSSHINSIIRLKSDSRANLAKTLIHESMHRILDLYNPEKLWLYNPVDNFRLSVLVEIIKSGINKLLSAIELTKESTYDTNYPIEKELAALHSYIPFRNRECFGENFYDAIKRDSLVTILSSGSYEQEKKISGEDNVIVEEALAILAFQRQEFLDYFFPGIYDFLFEVLHTAKDNLFAKYTLTPDSLSIR